jgi:hypothetical protein
MALASFIIALAFLPALSWFVATGAITGPEEAGRDGEASWSTIFHSLFLMIPAIAIVLGAIALAQIKQGDDRLSGSNLARLGIVWGGVCLLCLLSIPSMLTARDRAVVRRALRTVHAAEEEYRRQFPDVGYSPDLQSLGPPLSSGQPSADRAGLVSSDLAAGRYEALQAPLIYEPSRDDRGLITGYSIRVKWRVNWGLDQSGAIRHIPATREGEEPRR